MLRRKVQAGEFPPPWRLSSRRNVWPESAVRGYLESLKATGRGVAHAAV